MRRNSAPWWFFLSTYVLCGAAGLMVGLLILNEIEPNSPIVIGVREFLKTPGQSRIPKYNVSR